MKLLYFDVLQKMLPQQIDKLPSGVEFRVTSKRWKKTTVVRARKQWVGFGWVDAGAPTGREELLVMERDDPNLPKDMEVFEWPRTTRDTTP